MINTIAGIRRNFISFKIISISQTQRPDISSIISVLVRRNRLIPIPLRIQTAGTFVVLINVIKALIPYLAFSFLASFYRINRIFVITVFSLSSSSIDGIALFQLSDASIVHFPFMMISPWLMTPPWILPPLLSFECLLSVHKNDGAIQFCVFSPVSNRYVSIH